MIIFNDIYIKNYKNINILKLSISLIINEQVWNQGLGVQGQPFFLPPAMSYRALQALWREHLSSIPTSQ